MRGAGRRAFSGVLAGPNWAEVAGEPNCPVGALKRSGVRSRSRGPVVGQAPNRSPPHRSASEAPLDGGVMPRGYLPPLASPNRAGPPRARPEHADVAQLVEQLIRNQQVAGSNPAVGSKPFNYLSYSFQGRTDHSPSVATILQPPRGAVRRPSRSEVGAESRLLERAGERAPDAASAASKSSIRRPSVTRRRPQTLLNESVDLCLRISNGVPELDESRPTAQQPPLLQRSRAQPEPSCCLPLIKQPHRYRVGAAGLLSLARLAGPWCLTRVDGLHVPIRALRRLQGLRHSPSPPSPAFGARMLIIIPDWSGK